MRILDWFTDTVGTDNLNTVADKSGVVYTTLQRQLDKGTLKPELVIAISQAYHGDPIRALIITGYLTDADVERYKRTAYLDDFSDIELSKEVLRRATLRGESGMFDQPGSVIESFDS